MCHLPESQSDFDTDKAVEMTDKEGTINNYQYLSKIQILAVLLKTSMTNAYSWP